MRGRAELFRAFGVLSERPDEAHVELARSLGFDTQPTREEHTRIFGLSLYPYASVYLGPEGMLGGEARDRIAGFWTAAGYRPPAEPDHLAALLGLYAAMTDAAESEEDPARGLLRREARAALLWEHLLSWLPAYLAKMGDGSGFYAEWASMLLDALAEEHDHEPAGIVLPLHLRESPALCWIEDDDADEFLSAVLAPVRSGLILTRGDLLVCARELRLGARVGERLFMLKGLLSQDPVGVADWLSEYARDWSDRYLSLRKRFGLVMDHWMERADAAQTLLLGLQRAAKEVISSGTGS